MITVNVTATDYTVASSSVEYPVTVTADNTLFTVTSQVSTFTVTNVTPVISFDTEGADFDFAVKHRGEWLPNTDYNRNDVVRYENSIYICQIQFNVTLNSDVTPLVDTNSWELFYWNQWTKQYLTVTNWLNVGGDFTVEGNGTFTNDLTVLGNLNLFGPFIGTTGTFDDLTVNNQFTINGLRYPTNKGIYGQVLFTGGEETSQAAWVNLGELQAWSLNEDLYTNGFNIVSGIASDDTRPQLTIGNGETGNFRSYIEFPSGGQAIVLGGGDVNVYQNLDVAGELIVREDASLRGDVRILGNVGAGPSSPLILEFGIKFPDGTVQTSASTSTGFTATQIASSTRLGVIRVGQYLIIDEDNGVLEVDAGNLPTNYSLPAASTSTRGGIRIGNGLVITDNDLLSVSTSTAFGDVSLTTDMRTNGFKIVNGGILNPITGATAQPNLLVERYHIDLVAEPDEHELIIDGQNEFALLRANGGRIQLHSDYVEIGVDSSTSELRVQNIYNQAGTSAPFFPAGVQYQDNTIQRTAWRGYDQGLI